MREPLTFLIPLLAVAVLSAPPLLWLAVREGRARRSRRGAPLDLAHDPFPTRLPELHHRWAGSDGTWYLVVLPHEVGRSPRWWFERGAVVRGPDDPGHLHAHPVELMHRFAVGGGRAEILALVLA